MGIYSNLIICSYSFVVTDSSIIYVVNTYKADCS